MISIYCDGGYYAYDRVATWAFVAKDDTTPLHEQWGVVTVSNSHPSVLVAEYAAVYHAFAWLAVGPVAGEAVICSDSKIVVHQLKNNWKIGKRAAHLRYWYNQCHALWEHLPRVALKWVPREQNQEADALAARAFQEQRRHAA